MVKAQQECKTDPHEPRVQKWNDDVVDPRFETLGI
jgi:hypothetical protein